MAVKKGPKKKSVRFIKKESECYFTQSGTKPDYKDVLTLKRFTSDRGKLIPQKYTGTSAANQRLLTKEVKKARFMGLLPYTDQHAL